MSKINTMTKTVAPTVTQNDLGLPLFDIFFSSPYTCCGSFLFPLIAVLFQTAY